MLNFQWPVFSQGPAAPESIETAYACSGGDFLQRGLVLRGNPPNLPLSLGDVTVTVKDSLGVERTVGSMGNCSQEIP